MFHGSTKNQFQIYGPLNHDDSFATIIFTPTLALKPRSLFVEAAFLGGMGLSKSRFWWTKALTCLLGLTLVWYVFWWFHTFTIFVGVSQEYLLCTSIGCCSPDTKPALYEDLVFRDWPKRIGRSTWDGFDAWGYPQHGWFIMETAINRYVYINIYFFLFR